MTSTATGTPAAAPESPVLGRLSTLDRFLPVWIVVAMAVGLLLGRSITGLNDALDTVKVADVSLPITIGLLLMMYPVLAKVRYTELGTVTGDRRLLVSSLVLNWLIGPAVMFTLAWLLLPDLPTYRTGLIIVGLARCIAMVLIWNDLSCGDREAAAVLVAINSLFQIVAFAALGYFYLQVLPGWLGLAQSELHVSIWNIARSVLIFLGVPLLAGYLTRTLGERRRGQDWYEHVFLPKTGPLALYGLLFTIVVLFALQGDTITRQPWDVARIATPLLAYFVLMFGGAFLLGRKLGLGYPRTATLAFTAAGNNFELAIAVSISVFGVTSGQALAGVVGPLIEVPVLVALVYVALWLRRRLFPAAPSTTSSGIPSTPTRPPGAQSSASAVVAPDVSESFVTPATGLSAAQVASRVADGETNAVTTRTSRTLSEIVRGNVLTRFNGLLGALLLAVLATGRWQNGLFGLVIVANSGLGIVQEVRAKRLLDRLAIVNVPTARVVREARLSVVALGDVVRDDLLEVRVGDQVPADGIVLVSEGLELDESLLTGESEQVPKPPGADVRSGSIVVAGSGRYQATAVGAEAYAAKLAADARRFSLVHSELVAGTNRILRWISFGLLIVGPLLLWSQFRSAENHGWQDAVTGTAAGLVGMVPEGLLLLTSLAFVVATVTLTHQNVLIQELPAVEALARVDMVCLDKTGTLTDGDIVFQELIAQGQDRSEDLEQALGLFAASDSANSTAAALAVAFPTSRWSSVAAVPFNSTRKWSAVQTAAEGTWVLGAPEMVLTGTGNDPQVRSRSVADQLAEKGNRVLVLAASTSPLAKEGPPAALPPGLRAVALVVLAERVREDAAQTLAFFLTQGVSLKVISGDNPRTVGAVARAVGIPGAETPVDARGLPDDLEALADVLEEHSVFGRVNPQQKRDIVAALQRRGHVVAMTGDGVNDALALKDADIGIAMGNGSAATRAVAQIVLLDGQFARLPAVVAEGRRVIANIERAASLFLIKNSYSLVLALITASTLGAFPLAPIQLTMISTLTIGVPGFILALAPNTQRYVPGFVPRVLRFSLPIGIVTGLAAYTGYRVTRLLDPEAGVAEGRTTATFVIVIVSLWSVGVLARPLSGWKLALVATLAGVAAVVAGVPSIGRTAFLLTTTPLDLAVAGVVGLAGVAFVEITHRAVAAMTRTSRPRSEIGQRAESGPSTATGQAATRSDAELTEPSA